MTFVALRTFSADGKTPSVAEWNEIRRNVAKLKMELDRIELDFHDSSVRSQHHHNGGLFKRHGGGIPHGSTETSTSNAAVPFGNGLVNITEERAEKEDEDHDDGSTGDEIMEES